MLELLLPRSVFASTWIDRGTRLLLDSLPAGEPRTFLDLGCGYGALGLPLAAKFPGSRGLLVDRDLLAIEYCRRNSAAHGLGNVEAAGSLGYRDLPASWGPFDWILCNFPARAGARVLELFVAGGRRRLAPGGEMRIVVIAPLEPLVEGLSETPGTGGRRIAATPQHAVYAFPPEAPGASPVDEGLAAYDRDAIELELPGLPGPLRLVRPTDLADEPHRLRDAIPLLAESLPEMAPGGGRVLVFRCGYGLVAAMALAKYPGASVAATDRDLLGTAFTRRNCAGAAERATVVEAVDLLATRPHGPFDLVLGELCPPLGPRASLAELAAVRQVLAPGGRALVLGLAKDWREGLQGAAPQFGLARRGTRKSVGLLEMSG